MRGPTAEGTRRFLFLQGPHGPFFAALAAALRLTGAATTRIAFNAGDAAMWRPSAGLVPWRAGPDAWAATCGAVMEARGITDLVLYGDARPVHAVAIAAAQRRGITVHVFEEGYLRPWWATYERGGANGNSRLMMLGLDEMAAALDAAGLSPQASRHPPARWGEMSQHMTWGTAYHAALAAGRRRYPAYRPHRAVSPERELALHLRRLVTLPFSVLRRARATRRLIASARPYHVLLMQLAHDANLLAHGPFATPRALLDHVMQAFAEGAPGHHLLVVKAHPLEDGRQPLPRLVAERARAHGLLGRVLFLPGGKLAALLDHAASAVTVNSTAAQQALWRGLPMAALGRAVYAKPGLVDQRPLAAFFARPEPPDRDAYAVFRTFLLASSQLPGGYYSAAGRTALIRAVTDRMLDPRDPCDALIAPAPPLRLVSDGAADPPV